MPTVEAIRKMVQRNEGVAFLPRMCVEQEIRQGIAARGEGEGDGWWSARSGWCIRRGGR